MILDVAGVTHRFGGLMALNNVTLSLAEGSIAALIGPNGAGKTTLFSAISGFLTPDAGRVVFAGRTITGMQPHRIAVAGLVRTFQIVQPFAHLTVRENVAIGAHLHIKNRRLALEHAGEIAKKVGFGGQLDQVAGNLTVAGRKRLELARALATAPKLLLLDEVMAGLVPNEIEEIVAIIRAIRDGGVTVLLVEHIMQAVNSLAEHCFVLCDGALIASGSPKQVGADPVVIDAYLGAGAAERLKRSASHA
ncbi:MAG TPA: ABC transporter ATP-binding protein [Magnetospirillaceae bacterium]|jgi:branched-chain amino acid transport system ATP-binding protein